MILGGIDVGRDSLALLLSTELSMFPAFQCIQGSGEAQGYMPLKLIPEPLASQSTSVYLRASSLSGHWFRGVVPKRPGLDPLGKTPKKSRALALQVRASPI